MSERRPHWDFNLIEAVKAASTQYGQGTADSAFAVIAAVEDWARWEHVPKGTLARYCAGAGLCLACREEYPCAAIRALNRERAGR